MNYVEFLRVRNVARIVAIVLGCMLVLGVIGRVIIASGSHDTQAIIEQINKEPGTVTTHSVVDGHPQTTIVNARKHVRITVDQRSDGGSLVTIVEPRKVKVERDNMSFGSVNVRTVTGPVSTTTVIDTDHSTPFDIYLGFGFIVGLIVATILGASFSRENEGHLEFALLKPVTRSRYALGVIGVDLAGIAECQLMAIAAFILGQLIFEIPHFDFSGVQPAFVGIVFALPFAWYAGLNAATVSLKRGAGQFVGFAWPVSAVIIAIGSIDIQGTTLGSAIHAIFWTISRIIPLSYGSFSSVGAQVNAPAGQSLAVNFIIVTILLLVYGVLAIVQWRRVEA